MNCGTTRGNHSHCKLYPNVLYRFFPSSPAPQNRKIKHGVFSASAVASNGADVQLSFTKNSNCVQVAVQVLQTPIKTNPWGFQKDTKRGHGCWVALIRVQSEGEVTTDLLLLRLWVQQGVTTRIIKEGNTPQVNLDVNSCQTSVPCVFWRLFSPSLDLMCQMLVLILSPTQAECVCITLMAEMLHPAAFPSWSPLGDVAFRLATVAFPLYLSGCLILFFFVHIFCQVMPRFFTVYYAMRYPFQIPS